MMRRHPTVATLIVEIDLDDDATYETPRVRHHRRERIRCGHVSGCAHGSSTRTAVPPADRVRSLVAAPTSPTTPPTTTAQRRPAHHGRPHHGGADDPDRRADGATRDGACYPTRSDSDRPARHSATRDRRRRAGLTISALGLLALGHRARRCHQTSRVGASPGARTLNQWIKSPLLYH